MTRQTAKTTQARPTSPRPRDAAGNELDQWGLPIAGPLRAARLAELNKPDPHSDPEAWTSVAVDTPAQGGKDDVNG